MDIAKSLSKSLRYQQVTPLNSFHNAGGGGKGATFVLYTVQNIHITSGPYITWHAIFSGALCVHGDKKCMFHQQLQHSIAANKEFCTTSLYISRQDFLCFSHYRSLPTGPLCILLSVVFTPPPPQPPRQCLAPTCHLSTCAADFSLLNLPKGKSLGRSKPATNS
jgi:hypothetical protein